jgi:hypothetical protein
MMAKTAMTATHTNPPAAASSSLAAPWVSTSPCTAPASQTPIETAQPTNSGYSHKAGQDGGCCPPAGSDVMAPAVICITPGVNRNGGPRWFGHSPSSQSTRWSMARPLNRPVGPPLRLITSCAAAAATQAHPMS